MPDKTVPLLEPTCLYIRADLTGDFGIHLFFFSFFSTYFYLSVIGVLSCGLGVRV